MKLADAKRIVDIMDEDETTLYEDYSGRGMYGERTAGIVTASRDRDYLVECLERELDLDYEDDREEHERLSNAIMRARLDNMGMEYIFY
jgi:hypothetical protein